MTEQRAIETEPGLVFDVLVDGAPGAYTFWDYQAGAWQRNNGIRIDHALLSPQAADRLRGVTIHRDVRSWDKPSDHVPLVIELEA